MKSQHLAQIVNRLFRNNRELALARVRRPLESDRRKRARVP